MSIYNACDQKDEYIEGSECSSQGRFLGKPGSNFYELAEFVDFLGELTRTR